MGSLRRAALSLKEGDLLEANIENGKVFLSPKTVVDRNPEEAKKRLLENVAEQSARVEAQLKAEGKTWDELDAEIREEVKAYRKEQAEREATK